MRTQNMPKQAHGEKIAQNGRLKRILQQKKRAFVCPRLKQRVIQFGTVDAWGNAMAGEQSIMMKRMTLQRNIGVTS